jgi:hypothetical protein
MGLVFMVDLAILSVVLLRHVPAHSGRDRSTDPEQYGARTPDLLGIEEADHGCSAGARGGS